MTAAYHVAACASPWGWVAVQWTNGQLHRVVIGMPNRESALEAVGYSQLHWPTPPDAVRQLLARVERYVNGGREDFSDISVDLSDRTPFQRAVLQACRRVGYGQVISYAELGRKAGFPRSARAVGSVMASNRLPLIIPCHRVIGSDGALCGFSAPAGLSLKRQLLEMEGVLDAPRGGHTASQKVARARVCQLARNLIRCPLPGRTDKPNVPDGGR